MANKAKLQLWDDYLDNASVCMHCVDAEGTILWANQTELDFLGLSLDEYVGRSIVEFHVDRSTIDDVLARLTKDETLNAYPARLKHKSGAIRHVIINSNVYREGGEFIHTRCFTTGIDERTWNALLAAQLADG